LNIVLHFIAAHDVSIGIVGTIVVVLAVLSGYGRQHEQRRLDPDLPQSAVDLAVTRNRDDSQQLGRDLSLGGNKLMRRNHGR
jgi:hypothetical protein